MLHKFPEDPPWIAWIHEWKEHNSFDKRLQNQPAVVDNVGDQFDALF